MRATYAEGRASEGERLRTVNHGWPSVTLSHRVVHMPRTSGRLLARFKQIDAWLCAEAITEARHRGDDFVAQTFRDGQRYVASGRELPQADRDLMHEYLFGHEWSLKFARMWSVLGAVA